MSVKSLLVGKNESTGADEPVKVSSSGELLIKAAAGSDIVAISAKNVATGDTEIDASTASADAMSNTSNRLAVSSRLNIFNGTTWDRIRTVVGDTMAAIGLQAIVPMLWNGATYDRPPGNTSGQFVQGNVASGVTDAGNPVEIGGLGSSSTPTAVTTGQRVKAWFGLAGNTIVGITSTAPADGDSASLIPNLSGNGRGLGVSLSLYNNSTWNMQRNNHEVTALASAARTASANAPLTNYNARGVIVVINVTALTATGTLTVAIRNKDTLSGVFSAILTSAVIATTGTTVLMVEPGLLAAANLVANAPIARLFDVDVTAGNGVSITYSIGVNFVM